MTENKLLEAALRYAALGYAVFPCANSSNPVPLTRNGFKGATADARKIEDWWKRWPDACIGLATARLLVVDIDGAENTWLSDRPEHAADLASAPTSMTPSGGRHHIFRRPEGVAWRLTVGKLAVKVDTRTDGGYIVVPPSARPEGVYGWVEGSELDCSPGGLEYPPAWLCDELDRIHPAAIEVQHKERVIVPADSALIERAERYIATMPEAIQGNAGSGALYAAACVLVHGFGLDEGTAMGILARVYNPRCVPVWSVADLRHKVTDAAAKPHDRPYGYLRDEPARIADPGIDLSVLLGGPPVVAQVASGPSDPGVLPAHLLVVPGFIADVTQYNLDTAFRRQPVLALAGAICLQAVLAGRKVRDEKGSRTNLYCVGLAPSGMGKDHSRRVNKKILGSAGLLALEGPEELASDAGLATALGESPAALMQIDEFGRILRTMNEPNAPAHLKQIVTALIRLFSSADVLWKAKAYADAKSNRTVNQPCAIVYGTTVEESFLKSLTAENLRDGLIGRLLIFEGDRSPGRCEDAIAKDPPKEIVERASWWGKLQATAGNLENINPSPILIDTIDDASIEFRNLGELADCEMRGDDAGNALWARAEEKARRLALIYACSENHERPIIDGPAARWACELVIHNTRRTLYLAHQWVADGIFDARQKSIVRQIVKNGGTLTQNELSRRTQALTKRDRNEAVENLVETGQIVKEIVGSATRPALIFRVPI